MKKSVYFSPWAAALVLIVSSVMQVCAQGIIAQPATEEKLKISVYYETRCPDSIRFIKNQLYPVYLKMPDSVTIDLVPYGNAKTTVNPDGTFSFKCQHGPKECAGNKVHACAVNHVPLQPKLMAYINCTISSKNVWGSSRRCAVKQSIPFRDLAVCSTTEEGNDMLKHYGDRTSGLNPKVTWVPWVTFNDVFYHDEFAFVEKNLLGVVCKHLANPKPKACDSIVKRYRGYRFSPV